MLTIFYCAVITWHGQPLNLKNKKKLTLAKVLAGRAPHKNARTVLDLEL